jgi:protocatechuate 3,4-dioxygenase beta subunit
MSGTFNFHPGSEYWGAEVVFSGLVTDISDNLIEYGEGDHKGTYTESRARFTIEENFRGAPGETIEVVSGPSSACTYEYRQGERYFVYAHRSSDGKVRASIFSRTRPLASAAEDIAYAHDMAGGENGARIVGLVQRLSVQNTTSYGQLTPLADVRVMIEGANGQRWETSTDARGQFEVKGARPGTYVVRASLAENIRVSKFEEKVYIREAATDRFAGVLFTATSLASVGGRAVDNEGKPIRSLMIDLLAAPQTGGDVDSSRPVNTAITDEEGMYEFKNVAPGSYLVAVNPSNHIGRGVPAYARSYFPGRSSAAQARVIRVRENQTLRNDDFLVPPPRKERTFTGTVVMPDGTPASSAQVSLMDANDRGSGSNPTVLTDESGHFVIKGYEGYSYWLDAVLNPNDNSQREPDRLIFAPAFKPPAKGDVPEIRLVISSPTRVPPGTRALP